MSLFLIIFLLSAHSLYILRDFYLAGHGSHTYDPSTQEAETVDLCQPAWPTIVSSSLTGATGGACLKTKQKTKVKDLELNSLLIPSENVL